MTACLDTGVFLQIFGRKQPFHPILRALLDGRLILAVSTEILLEYQEVTTRLSGAERWRDMAALLDLLAQLHGNIRHIEPKFRFNVISTDLGRQQILRLRHCCRGKFRGHRGQRFQCLEVCRVQTEAHQAGRIYPSILASVTARQNDDGRSCSTPSSASFALGNEIQNQSSQTRQIERLRRDSETSGTCLRKSFD